MSPSPADCATPIDAVRSLPVSEKGTQGPRILCVEDDPSTGRLIKAIAEKEGYAFDLVTSEKEFLRAVTEGAPDLCLIDLTLPDASGLDLLQKLKDRNIEVPTIIVTASEAIENVIGAWKLGALDYITKPIDARRLVVSVGNALRLDRQKREIGLLRAEAREAYSVEHLVGASPAMERVRGLIRRAATSDTTVLIVGESGTGKELVARALHAGGSRAAAPCVDVNSAALSETLLESELFGHEKGAFTSAVGRRKGKFEQAHGGTLFLDEIGDMPLSTQAKILRALQERSFERVGGDEKIRVDVRVVCATNRNLEEAVEKGGFRKDLFYRINALVIEVPPLRERKEDIAQLATHFLAVSNREERRQVRGYSPAAMAALGAHSWPGNVRELEHAVQRAVLVCDQDEIQPEHLPTGVSRAPSPAAAPVGTDGLIETVERLERSMILAALEKGGWVKARAARTLKVSERILSYKMDNLGIERPPQ